MVRKSQRKSMKLTVAYAKNAMVVDVRACAQVKS